MAKKKSKAVKKSAPAKPAAKAPKAAAKKPAAKLASKPAAKPSKKPAAKASKKNASLDPVPVSTGKGMGPDEVGGALVAMFNAGKLAEIENNFWSPEIISCEGSAKLEWRGRPAVEAKNNWWLSENEILGATAEGPFVGATSFAVRFKMQVRAKASGTVSNFEEVGVYTVHNGKIVREEFMGRC